MKPILGKRKVKNKNYVFKVIFFTFLCFFSLCFFSLIFYGFYTSFKSLDDFVFNTWRLPTEWHPENYITIINNFKLRASPLEPYYYIESMFAMSFVYSLLSAFATVLAIFLTAYACSQFPSKMSSLIYFIAMFMIVVPIIGAYPSEYKMIQSLHLYNNVSSVLFLKLSFGSVYFLLTYHYLKKIPAAYKEAANVDGASLFRVMVQIILPLSINILGSIFLIQFITYWNDYQTPLLYFPGVPNISVGLLKFITSTSGPIAGEPFKLGACFIVVLPILIVFIIFQKRLMNNMSSGGIKG